MFKSRFISNSAVNLVGIYVTCKCSNRLLRDCRINRVLFETSIQSRFQRLLSTKDPVQQKKANAEFKKAQRKFGQNMVQTITSDGSDHRLPTVFMTRVRENPALVYSVLQCKVKRNLNIKLLRTSRELQYLLDLHLELPTKTNQ